MDLIQTTRKLEDEGNQSGENPSKCFFLREQPQQWETRGHSLLGDILRQAGLLWQEGYKIVPLDCPP